MNLTDKYISPFAIEPEKATVTDLQDGYYLIDHNHKGYFIRTPHEANVIALALFLAGKMELSELNKIN